MKEKILKAKEEAERIKRELNEKIVSYILAALGLVAGLAWNDAIKSLIEYFFKFSRNTILVKFIYAILITFIVVILSRYLLKLFSSDEKKSAQEEKNKKS